MTVNRDLRPVANATTEENKSVQGNGLQNDVVDNATNPPATRATRARVGNVGCLGGSPDGDVPPQQPAHA